MDTSTHHPRLTWRDHQALPESNRFVELIDGELVELTSPVLRHQRVVTRLVMALGSWAEQAGGLAVSGPLDLLVDEHNVLQPDVLAYGPARLHLVTERPITAPPDLVVEVLSPSNRRHDLIRKRPIYARFGVPTLWIVDAEIDQLRVDRLGAGGYGVPELAPADGVLGVDGLPGFTLPVARVLPPG